MHLSVFPYFSFLSSFFSFLLLHSWRTNVFIDVPLFVPMSVSLCLPLSLSLFLSVSLHLSLFLSIFLVLSLSVCLFVCCGGGGVDEHWFVNGGWKPGREGVGTTKSSPLAKLIRTLATLYQNKHQFCSCATTRSSTSRTPSTPRLRTGKCSRT